MSSKRSDSDGIDGYNESVWRTLGHPAFDDESLISIEDLEWWDPNDDIQEKGI